MSMCYELCMPAEAKKGLQRPPELKLKKPNSGLLENKEKALDH